MTYSQSKIINQVGAKPQHSSAERVAEFGQQNQIKNLVLTHFSLENAVDIVTKQPTFGRMLQ